MRSQLPGTEFAPLVGVSPHTLYCWRRAFEQEGPAGLVQKPRGAPSGSRLPEVTKRAILLIKSDHPEWGCQRISDVLMRESALGACAASVANVLHEAGYELEELPTRPHPPATHRFERARPNQLWQTDLFTFMLKRQNRRVYLVGYRSRRWAMKAMAPDNDRTTGRQERSAKRAGKRRAQGPRLPAASRDASI